MTLLQILNSVDKKYERVIGEICKAWKKKVQEGLKDIMKLSMSSGINIIFNIAPACPSHINNIILTPQQYEKFILFQKRPLLERLKKDLPDFSKFIDKHSNYLPHKPNQNLNLGIIEDYISTLYSKIPVDDELFKNIMQFNEDIFGTYVAEDNKGTVNIYWAVIALFAERWDVDLEAFTNIILSHEYAHAYTHLAVDANNLKWKLSDFQRADKYIKEGLAEYYSFMFTMQQNKSEWIKIYELLLRNSPPVYQDYINWRNPSLEAVRYALACARRAAKLDYDIFKDFITEGMVKYGHNQFHQTPKFNF